MIEVKRKEGESMGAFLHRFSIKMKQSGVLLEAKKRRYRKRAVSRRARKVSAIYRAKKKKEFTATRKTGRA